jgi:hypothetical protein
MLAMAPAQQGQWHHRYNGKDACALTMAMTPLWRGQWHQLDDGNSTIAMRATTLLQQWQRCLDCKDTCTSTMATPLQQGQQHQLNNSKEACALMMATTPLLQGQQRQLDDYASLTTAETPSRWGQQLPSQQWWRCLRINGKNAIATKATMPLWWQWGCLRIDDDKDTIVMRAMMPAWGQWWCHHNKGNNAIMDQGQQRHCYEGNNTSLTTTRTPAHWQLQQHYCHEANNPNGINGKDACASMVMAPLQRGWRRATRATMLAQQRWRCLCMDNGNNIDNRHCNNRKDACALTAITPSQQGQQLQLDNEQQGRQR